MKSWRHWIAAGLCAALLMTSASGAAADGGGGEGGPVGYLALTFDDGPTGPLTEKLLDGLRQRYVSATFFLCGYRMEQYPDVVRRMQREGHQLAIHGQTHAFLHNQPAQVVREEVETAAGLLTQITGERPQLFRPPGGLVSQAVTEEAAREGLSVILWSADPEDWNTHSSSTVVHRILKKAKDGDIILMHDLSPSSVQAALQVVDLLEARGYQFCTVSELATLRGQSLEPGQSYHSFPSPAQDSFFPESVLQ